MINVIQEFKVCVVCIQSGAYAACSVYTMQSHTLYAWCIKQFCGVLDIAVLFVKM